MTEKEYRSHPAISRSELHKITVSPEKFKYEKDNPSPATAALIFGQAFHKIVLEPLTFGEEFAVAPDCDRRTKDGKMKYNDFVNSLNGQTIISEEDYQQISAMRDKLMENDFVKKLLAGEKEVPYFWTDEKTGEECKVRADCVTDLTEDLSVIIDLKTTTNASDDSFRRDAINYGYDFQAGMYKEGIDICRGKKHGFVFIAIEKAEPYSINILQADDLVIKRGNRMFHEALGIYHDCKLTDNWYGYLGKNNAINNLSLPAWLAKEVE